MNKENKGLMSAFKVWLSSFDAKSTTSDKGDVKFEMVTLDDKVTKLEADSFESGQSVAIVVEDGENVPLPKGEYLLDDGQVLVLEEDGIIASIGQPTEDVEETKDMEDEKEVAQADNSASSPVAKKIVEAITKETHFSKEDVSLITDRVNIMLSETEITDPTVDRDRDNDAPVVEPTPEPTPEPATEEKVELSEEVSTGLVDAPKQDAVEFSVSGSSLMDLLNR
ncbi:MAG: hypothetical protein HRU26_10490 [Psychroserpens sp.]|nr:hypothetical protein [Psychroserpens sp.]